MESVKQKIANALGKYKKGSGSVNPLIGISRDEVDPFEYHELYIGVLYIYHFYCYMENFINWLQVNRPH